MAGDLDYPMIAKLHLTCVGGIDSLDRTGRPYRTNTVVYHSEGGVKLEQVSYEPFSKENYEVLKRFFLPYERIEDIDIISNRNILKKQKSVIGRGVTGAVLFGPVGAIVGGMSGIGAREIKTVSTVLCIAYQSRTGEYRNICFAVEKPSDVDAIVQFIQEYRKRSPKSLPDAQRDTDDNIIF